MTPRISFVRVLALFLGAAFVLAPLPVPHPDVRAQPRPGTPLTMPQRAALARAEARAVEDVPPALEELPPLEEVRDLSAAQAALLPEEEWDVQALAFALEFDPEQAFAFVRDRIAFDPYAGVLRGAEGTLAARAGNAYDRALLLAALLKAMAVETRFAFAELDADTVARLVERASQTPASPLPTPGAAVVTTIDIGAIQARAERDYARLHRVMGDRLDAIPGPDIAEIGERLRDHAWVQAAYGPDWRDLDPTLPDAVPGSALAAATMTLAAMPSEAHQSITLRLVVGSLEGGTLSERTVLEHRFGADAAAASRVFLYFDADVGRFGGGAITEALTGDEMWLPALIVDDIVEWGQPFQAGGRGTDAFGEATEVPDLVSIRLHVERSAPGAPAVRATRVLLDRIPAGLQNAPSLTPAELLPLPRDEGGPYALGQIHHLMFSTGGTDLRDFALQRAASADFAGRAFDPEAADDTYGLQDVLWPVAVADQALVVVSETAVIASLASDSVRAYVATPRVYIASFGRDPGTGDLAFAKDLLIDDVALLPRDVPSAGDAPRRLLWYGAAQTAIETEVALKHAALLEPDDRTLIGASLGMEERLALLTQEQAGTLGRDAAPALRGALAAGSFAIVPGDPEVASAWWTVDPRSGLSRSVLDPGLGGVRPAERVGPSPRISDSSYGHGAGPRLPPRPPMIRPPGGSTYAPPTSCAPASEGTITIGCLVVPVGLALKILGGVVVVGFFVAWYVL